MGKPIFTQALVETLPQVAQMHADGEFIRRLVEAAGDLRKPLGDGDVPRSTPRHVHRPEFIHISLDRLQDDLVSTAGCAT